MSERLVVTAEARGQRLSLGDGSASLRFVPQLGLSLPRYHFHVGRIVHAAQELGLFRVQTTLLLGNDLTGQAELCDFQADSSLSEAAQAHAFSRLIDAAVDHAAGSAVRGESLIAELPGWRDAQGASPFWEAFGARLYRGDPAVAEARLGAAWRSHLAALLPQQTVYLSLLGAAAEAQLRRHAASAAALEKALTAAGFEPSDHVRIDDGGPVLSRRLSPR
jgi:arginine/ornithine succinyltransferase subunit-like protein